MKIYNSPSKVLKIKINNNFREKKIEKAKIWINKKKERKQRSNLKYQRKVTQLNHQENLIKAN